MPRGPVAAAPYFATQNKVSAYAPPLGKGFLENLKSHSRTGPIYQQGLSISIFYGKNYSHYRLSIC